MEKDWPKYWPILYPEFKTKGLLFIGLNPSAKFDALAELELGEVLEKKNKKEKKEMIDKRATEIEGKLNRAQNNLKKNWIIELERKAIDGYDYYQKFRDIADELKTDFQHIDLFFFRDTSQEDAKKTIGYKELEKECDVMGTGKKKVAVNKFAVVQLEVAKAMIEEINPRVIVVVNALASDIINCCVNCKDKEGKKENKLFEVDTGSFDVCGYDFLKLGKKSYPIIFSSMLSGQRALDRHSLRRLKWIIKRAWC